jgi:hypothetical protein
MFPVFQNPVAMVYVGIYPDFPTYHDYMGYCTAYLAVYRHRVVVNGSD